MSQPVHQVGLLLGSNIEPEKNLPRAIELLRQEVAVLRLSSVWQTPPVDQRGPDFLNMALLAATPLQPSELKERVVRPLEARLGRVRTADKNAPRPIDVDIVSFDDTVLDKELFTYAHRAVPVSEILPALLSPEGDSLERTAGKLLKTSPIHLKPDVYIES